MITSSDPLFFVNSEDSSFCKRQKCTFAQLDAAIAVTDESLEKPNLQNECFQDRLPYSSTMLNRNSRRNNDTKSFRGKESIFKRPEAPPPARVKRDIPDFKRNPHKWTKYSLSDVSPEDMSEQSNTAAALSYLQELNTRKKISEKMDVDSKARITFKRPNENTCHNLTPSVIVQKQINDYPTQEEGPCFRSSKLIMPEYVVGQKLTKKKVKSSPRKNPTKEIKLDHLAEEDGENSE